MDRESSRATASGVSLKVVRGTGVAGPGRLVATGVPLPQGLAKDSVRWKVTCADGTELPVQSRTLARWPDGSVQWLFVLLPVHSGTFEQDCLLQPVIEDSAGFPGPAVPVQVEHDGVIVDTGASRFQVRRGTERLFAECPPRRTALDDSGCRLICTNKRGKRSAARLESLEVEESGPLRAKLRISGRLGAKTGLRFSGTLCFHAGSGLVRIEITVQNPRRARHAGGFWDLGDPGSVLIGDLSIEAATAAPAERTVQWLETADAIQRATSAREFEIYQDSSGGANWQGRNHINRDGRVPQRFRGYRVRTESFEHFGLRANPVVSLVWDGNSVGCALEDFWQQFPSALQVQGSHVIVRLWPRQFDDLHELQAGEHNSRTVWFEFGTDADACQRLAWVHDPPVARVDPAWVAASRAIPFLPDPETPSRQALTEILDEAVQGEHSFFAKREAIDEYGWRNFGDTWADHEQAYCDDPKPVVSHYNNQYDLLYGLLIQWLQSGDERWRRLADPLARHVMDVDIYHTDRDKPLYNHGLFWHTAHYHDAGRATHRSMSTTMRGKRQPAPGGGPANEHAYSSGLLLYHYLTGCSRARETVIGLGDWSIAMDDGQRHVLGVLCGTATGDASRTTAPDYHGPGRGAGNSINVLLDAWLVTGGRRFLDKSVELIRRTVHPQDDVAQRDLGNAELRWSYTVYLQSLARFLELTSQQADLSAIREYVRAALLRYARWMAENERFYLDEPEKLEFPTETWAAQELRKGTVLWLAARHANEPDCTRFREKGSEILDRAWKSLMSFPSRTCTRPVTLVLQQGYLERYLVSETTDSPVVAEDGNALASCGAADVFTTQKQRIRDQLRSPAAVIGLLGCAVRPSRWYNAVRQTWPAERLRQVRDLYR
jgi:hypothetical protein